MTQPADHRFEPHSGFHPDSNVQENAAGDVVPYVTPLEPPDAFAHAEITPPEGVAVETPHDASQLEIDYTAGTAEDVSARLSVPPEVAEAVAAAERLEADLKGLGRHPDVIDKQVRTQLAKDLAMLAAQRIDTTGALHLLDDKPEDAEPQTEKTTHEVLKYGREQIQNVVSPDGDVVPLANLSDKESEQALIAHAKSLAGPAQRNRRAE